MAKPTDDEKASDSYDPNNQGEEVKEVPSS